MLFDDLLKQVESDPETQVDPMWLDSLMQNIDKDTTYHYLVGKTRENINNEKEEILCNYGQSEKWSQSLAMYRVIHDIQDLRLGIHTRWIRENPGKDPILTNGGIHVQTKFLDKGTYIVLKNGKKIMQYNLDHCKTFQKITLEEWVVIMANEHN